VPTRSERGRAPNAPADASQEGVTRTVIAAGTPREVLRPDVLERTYGAPMQVLEHGGMPLVVDVPANVVPLRKTS